MSNKKTKKNITVTPKLPETPSTEKSDKLLEKSIDKESDSDQENNNDPGSDTKDLNKGNSDNDRFFNDDLDDVSLDDPTALLNKLLSMKENLENSDILKDYPNITEIHIHFPKSNEFSSRIAKDKFVNDLIRNAIKKDEMLKPAAYAQSNNLVDISVHTDRIHLWLAYLDDLNINYYTANSNLNGILFKTIGDLSDQTLMDIGKRISRKFLFFTRNKSQFDDLNVNSSNVKLWFSSIPPLLYTMKGNFKISVNRNVKFFLNLRIGCSRCHLKGHEISTCPFHRFPPDHIDYMAKQIASIYDPFIFTDRADSGAPNSGPYDSKLSIDAVLDLVEKNQKARSDKDKIAYEKRKNRRNPPTSNSSNALSSEGGKDSL